MVELPPYTIREYQAGDEHAILETFNRVFAAIDPNFVPRTMASWRWRYLENPSGWRIWLAALEDGSIISQYAGISQRMLLDGEPARFSQAVDSMTDPAWRRGLKKPGFFVLTGYPYAANYGGPPPDDDTVMWGLPIPSAWRIGKTFLDYELVRTQCKLRARVEDVLAGLGNSTAGATIQEVERFPEEVGELSTAAAARHRALAVRDAAQLNWRYPDNPDRSYRIALARGGGELQGYAVYASGRFDLADDGLVCDWLVREGAGGQAAARELHAWLAERARADGVEHLAAIFPDTASEWIDFQKAGYRVRPTMYFLVGRNYVKRYTMLWLHKNWYYTLGDTDLC